MNPNQPLNIALALSVAAVLLLSNATQSIALDKDEFWPEWRGPQRTGVSLTADPVITWSETNNVRWKVAVPGSGTGSPVLWGENVFVLTAVQARTNGETAQSIPVHQFNVLAYKRKDGQMLWSKTVKEEVPHEKHHPDHGYASSSPLTDGEVLIAYFGSRGLHCLDLKGNLKWSKDLGKMQTRNAFGEGASPAMEQGIVVVNWDDEADNDFIVAFDKASGKELWRKPRNEHTGWATPLIVKRGDGFEVIVNAEGKVRSYNLKDGAELWQCGGQTANPIPTPVADKEFVYVTSGFRGNAVMAITLGRTGDLTGTDAIRWTRSKNTPYVPSPLLAADCLYLVTGNNPVLTCLDIKTGNPFFEAEKMEGISGIYASPVAAKDRVYVLGRNGTCLVLKVGPKPEILARNVLGEKTDASIALSGKDLFIRSQKSLYCIGE